LPGTLGDSILVCAISHLLLPEYLQMAKAKTKRDQPVMADPKAGDVYQCETCGMVLMCVHDCECDQTDCPPVLQCCGVNLTKVFAIDPKS
jgi:hypothetical protein